jgi:hypothetical protein
LDCRRAEQQGPSFPTCCVPRSCGLPTRWQRHRHSPSSCGGLPAGIGPICTWPRALEPHQHCAVLPPRPSATQGTFAKTHRNGRGARRAAVRGTEMERQGSTQRCHSCCLAASELLPQFRPLLFQRHSLDRRLALVSVMKRKFGAPVRLRQHRTENRRWTIRGRLRHCLYLLLTLVIASAAGFAEMPKSAGRRTGRC